MIERLYLEFRESADALNRLNEMTPFHLWYKGEHGAVWKKIGKDITRLLSAVKGYDCDPDLINLVRALLHAYQDRDLSAWLLKELEAAYKAGRMKPSTLRHAARSLRAAALPREIEEAKDDLWDVARAYAHGIIERQAPPSTRWDDLSGGAKQHVYSQPISSADRREVEGLVLKYKKAAEKVEQFLGKATPPPPHVRTYKDLMTLADVADRVLDMVNE